MISNAILREYKTSMDNLEFVTVWLRSGIPNAQVAMKWSGLQMEGASFDGSRLLHNSHDSPSITVAPVCTVAWIPKVSLLTCWVTSVPAENWSHIPTSMVLVVTEGTHPSLPNILVPLSLTLISEDWEKFTPGN